MAFNFDKLWVLLEKRDIKTEEFRELISSSPNTIVKLRNNEAVALDIIDRICKHLKCIPDDIMEYIPETELLYDIPEIAKGDIFNTISHTPRHGIVKRERLMRPSLIYQSNAFIPLTKSVMIIPITSRIGLGMASTDVLIEPDELNKLKAPATFMIGAMHSIPKHALVEKMGYLNNEYMALVDRACAMFFGIRE